MISDKLYRLIGLSLWNIDETVDNIQGHIDDFNENSNYDYKDLVLAKMIYEADVNELFPHPDTVYDETFMNTYIGYLLCIEFKYDDKIRYSKTIRDTIFIEDANSILKVFLWTKDIDFLILYTVKVLCEFSKVYYESGEDVPVHLSKTINAIRKRYSRNIARAMHDYVENFYMVTYSDLPGYSIYKLRYNNTNGE